MSDGLNVSINQTLNISVPKEDVFPMRTKDWVRMRQRLATIRRQRTELSAAAWTSVGVLITAIFAAIAWAPAFAGLAPGLRVEFVWIWPAIIGFGVVGTVLMIALFWAGHVMKDHQKITISSIVDDMDTIHDVRELLAETV